MDTPSCDHGPSLRTVLNIEDNPANATLIEELFDRRKDLNLIAAVTGVRGIEMAKQWHPEVILLDINLPDLDGMAVLKILLSSAETAHIPVIALSSNAFPKQIEKGLHAGFFAYLTKPFKIVDLMDCVDLALSHRRNKDEQH